MTADFEAALAAAQHRMGTGNTIGRLQEKTLHATLKFFLDPDETHHEILLQHCPGKLVADIFDGERVTEIQNGNFSGFRDKLTRLLAYYPVTVMYPITRQKQIVWIDPVTGAATGPVTSPKTGRPADALPELLYIEQLLFHPRLTLRLLPVDVIEYRLQDGWGNDGKRGAHRLDRQPRNIGEPVDIDSPASLFALLPPLPDTFTRADLAKALRMRGRRLSAALKLLLLTGCIMYSGKCGNTYIYTQGAAFSKSPMVSSKPS